MRNCGDCKTCCTVEGVLELGKQMFDPCSKLCSHGCSIYDRRPAECQSYVCLWLEGFLPIRMRPDRSGLVFSVSEEPEGTRLLIIESRRGAAVSYERLERLILEFPTDVQNLVRKFVPFGNRIPLQVV